MWLANNVGEIWGVTSEILKVFESVGKTWSFYSIGLAEDNYSHAMDTRTSPKSTLVLNTDNTAVTEDGLTLKNLGKITAITSRMGCEIQANLASWQVSRTIRRDFYLVTATLYKRSADSSFRRQVQELLLEMVLQAENLASYCRNLESNPDTSCQRFPLRLVSAEASQLYRAFKQADASLGKLNYALTSGALSREQFSHYSVNFDLAYGDFKKYVIGAQQSNKTAGEIGAEQGIT